MTPATLDLTIVRGVRSLHRLQCLDSDEQPVNLTGYTPKVQARKTPAAPVAFDVPFTLHEAAAGELQVDFTPAVTAQWPLGRWGWDLLLIAADGTPYGPFFTGSLSVTDTHTRPAA
jgi:hypothetical protein